MAPTQPPLAGQGRPFTLAEVRAASPVGARVRLRTLAIPTSGVRACWPGRVAPDLRAQAEAVALVLPGGAAYSHATAARLLGMPLPRRWSPAEPLEVMTPTAAGRVQRRGVLGHRGLERRRVWTVAGLPVVAPSDTLLDLAGRLEVVDLVVLADAMLNRWPGTVELAQAARRAGRARAGAGRAARALELARPGSGSPMESRARVAFVSGGIAEPELNATVYDEGGRWLATGDFVWRSQRVIVEYEGDHHRTDRRQWQSDIARTRLLEALGWRVIRITALDLRPDRVTATLALVREALAASKW